MTNRWLNLVSSVAVGGGLLAIAMSGCQLMTVVDRDLIAAGGTTAVAQGGSDQGGSDQGGGHRELQCRQQAILLIGWLPT